MEEQMKKAFEVSIELSKQLLTLSTGIIALTITFREKFANSTPRLLNCLGLPGSFIWYLLLAASGTSWH